MPLSTIVIFFIAGTNKTTSFGSTQVNISSSNNLPKLSWQQNNLMIVKNTPALTDFEFLYTLSGVS